jgi:hypothetical protein
MFGERFQLDAPHPGTAWWRAVPDVDATATSLLQAPR